MHHAANDKTAGSTTRKVQRCAFLHVEMLDQPSFGEKVRRQLHGAAKTGSNRGRSDSPVEALDALAAIDFSQPVQGVLVSMLGADRKEERERLQPRLGQEEGRSGSGAENARSGAREDVDT